MARAAARCGARAGLVVRRFRSSIERVYAISSVARGDGHDLELTRVCSSVGALPSAAGVASLWLARTLAKPIDDLTESLARMAETKDLDGPLPRSGISREIDALADSFDTLRSAVSQAEAESDAAYLGVIGALAAALDARDPYTAGHSQRVADLSVLLAKEMELRAGSRDNRAGRAVHDIARSASDSVLRKREANARVAQQATPYLARVSCSREFLAPHLRWWRYTRAPRAAATRTACAATT